MEGHVASRSKLKKDIRSLQRLLNKKDLAATVKQETERKVHALEVQLSQAMQGEVERELATKYRMVRFFERRKIMRQLQKAQKKLAADDSDNGKADLEQKLRCLQSQMYYVQNFPVGRKYVALFPNNETTRPEVDEFRQTLLAKIEEQIAAGSIVVASVQDHQEDESDEVEEAAAVPTKEARHNLDQDERFVAVFEKLEATGAVSKNIAKGSAAKSAVDKKAAAVASAAAQKEAASQKSKPAPKSPSAPHPPSGSSSKKRPLPTAEDEDGDREEETGEDDFFASSSSTASTAPTAKRQEYFVEQAKPYRVEDSSRRSWLRQIKDQRNQLSAIGSKHQQDGQSSKSSGKGSYSPANKGANKGSYSPANKRIRR